MASHNDASDSSPRSPASRAPMRSQKLSRTLKELESAFTDWESLSTEQAPAAAEVDVEKNRVVQANEQEFRTKTKKLLSQLRQQLAELNE